MAVDNAAGWESGWVRVVGMRHPRPLPSDMHPAFSIAEAVQRGISVDRVKRRDLAAPFHGVRATVHATRRDELSALLRSKGDGVVAFGPTAAALHAMAVPRTSRIDAGTAYLATRRPARAPRGRGVTGASLTIGDLDVTSVDGVGVTTRARTWVDLARFLDVARLVACADALCSPTTDVCSTSELAAALERAGSVRGVEIAREALQRIDPGAESIAESLLRVALIDAGLPVPVVNPTIRDRGRFVARVDLLFERYGVIVEYEGLQHATDPRQWRRDLTRIGELQRLGYIVERAHADDLRDPRALIDRLRTHLRRRGWTRS